MVTAPISKHALKAAGYPDTGHTTMLARLTATRKPVMMLAGSRLKVVPVTVHMSLKEALASLSTKEIVETGRLAARELSRFFGLKSPRLAVAALNPHAGEEGLFGDEEGRIIAPAVKELKDLGLDATGPHPPDTVFWRAAAGQFDLVLGMYHDQALIPLKLIHFEDAVNVTLGLPVIRTSVDHGTAYDIAGRGQANPASLKAAVLMAAQMARKDAVK
jgi:4-hydroxythreonine-4-phosphate dehydrogenase